MKQVQTCFGKWFTRNQRLVIIDETREVEDAPQPGMDPVRRMIFSGALHNADGKTVASRNEWEPDGRFRTHQGVATEFDLVSLIAG